MFCRMLDKTPLCWRPIREHFLRAVYKLSCSWTLCCKTHTQQFESCAQMRCVRQASFWTNKLYYTLCNDIVRGCCYLHPNHHLLLVSQIPPPSFRVQGNILSWFAWIYLSFRKSLFCFCDSQYLLFSSRSISCQPVWAGNSWLNLVFKLRPNQTVGRNHGRQKRGIELQILGNEYLPTRWFVTTLYLQWNYLTNQWCLIYPLRKTFVPLGHR